MRQRADYQEVREFWSLDEVLDALEVLDIFEDLSEDQAEIDRREAKRKARK